ncbi:MAG: AMP-binding protein, partial [Candidatus Omnitrophota bacterium]
MPFLLTEKLKSQVTKNLLKNIIYFKTKDSQEELNYADFYKKSTAITNFLLKKNSSKEDPVAIILENRPEWGIVYFGILFSGSACVPLDAQLTPQEIKNILCDCKPQFIFCSQKTILQVRQATEAIDFIKEIILIDDFFKKEDNLELEKFPQLNLDSPCSILYTSGTTARPKAVVLTHRNFSSNFESIKSLNLVNQNDIFLSILPLHHSYPFMATLILPLFIGAKIIYLDTLNPEEISKIIKEKNITIFVTVPQILANLNKTIFGKIKKIPLFIRLSFFGILEIAWIIRRYLKLNISKIIFAKLHKNFPKLRFFVCGGARLDKDISRDFLKLGFNIIEGYGLTETSPIVTLNTQKINKVSSVGKTIPEVEVKIIDPDEKGLGEIAIRGQNVMQGYYKNTQDTEKVLKDNWFYSGDLGFLDKENYLYIEGRIKEVLVLSSGKNIYPEEIENHYLKSLFIKEMCVFIKQQNNLETLQAVIIPNYEQFKKAGIVDIRNKIKWELDGLGVHLPGYKHIMGFIISNQELPRTRLGKLKRYEIQNLFKKDFLNQTQAKEEILSPEDQVLLNLDTTRKIINYLEETKDKKIKLYDHLELDLGIDSLERVEVILSLEKIFKITIPENSLREVFSVKDLILKIDEIAKYGKTKENLLKEPEFLWQDILKQSPPEDILNRIDLEPNFLNRLASFLLGFIFYLFFKIFFRLKIKGL